MKFSTLQTICQELFSSFFKLFRSVIRRVLQLCRCLADSFDRLPHEFRFVNTFFHFFAFSFLDSRIGPVNCKAHIFNRYSPEWNTLVQTAPPYRLFSSSAHSLCVRLGRNFFAIPCSQVVQCRFFPNFATFDAHIIILTKKIILHIAPLYHLHSFRFWYIMLLPYGFR